MRYGSGLSLSSRDRGRQEAHETVPQVRRMVSVSKRSMYHMWWEGVLGAQSTQGEESAERTRPDDRVPGRNAKGMPNLRHVESRIRQKLLRKVWREALAYSREVSFLRAHKESRAHKLTRDASNGLGKESPDNALLTQNQERDRISQLSGFLRMNAVGDEIETCMALFAPRI